MKKKPPDKTHPKNGRRAYIHPHKKTIDKNIVFECGTRGLPIKYVCHACGVSRDTWYQKCKEDPDIYEAYKAGLQVNCDEIISKIREISIETKNMAGLIFLAKTTHGMREQVQINHVGADENQPIKIQSQLEIKIESMTPEQRRARIAELELKRVNDPR